MSNRHRIRTDIHADKRTWQEKQNFNAYSEIEQENFERNIAKLDSILDNYNTVFYDKQLNSYISITILFDNCTEDDVDEVSKSFKNLLSSSFPNLKFTYKSSYEYNKGLYIYFTIKSERFLKQRYPTCTEYSNFISLQSIVSIFILFGLIYVLY